MSLAAAPVPTGSAQSMMGGVAVHTSSTMIGRDAELAQIAASLGVRPAREATSYSDVLLSGDAGVGKTRLLRALRDLAFADGWAVYAGHCLDFGESALPYLPFSEVVDRIAAARPEVVAEVTAQHPALSRLQPGRRVMAGTDRVDDDRAALDRADLFRAVLALLETAAESGPVLLVIEDTHWADQSTRDMLSFLLSRVDSGGFAVVASYRSDDLHRRHPLRRQVAEWSRLRGVDRVALSPLADDAVRDLVAALVPGGLPEHELGEIVARAEGNAFFVEELTSAAAEPGIWVPADLADVLLVRLDRLETDASQVVRTASVSGRRVSHAMLEAVSGLSPEALDAGLRQAVEMNVLVTERGHYAFRHALLGEAVYDDLLPGERARLHTAYVTALRDGTVVGTAAELARHARLALDRATAFTASVKAGNEASGVGGPDEAAHHYQQALELLADHRGGRLDPAEFDVDLSKLVANTAQALTASGDPERAVAVIQEQLDRLPDDAPDSWRARMLSAQAGAAYITESQIDAAELSGRAVALAPQGESGLRARVLTVHARILGAYARFEEAHAVGMEALELAERLDLTELASDAITTLGGLKKTGPKEGLRAALTDAVAQASASGAVEAELRGRFLLGRSYEDWGEFDDAATWFDSAMRRAREAGLEWAPYGFDARWQLAWIRYVQGDWQQALALLTAAGGQRAPALQRAMMAGLRLSIDQARGADVTGEVSSLRPMWQRDGVVAIHTAGVQMRCQAAEGDLAGVLDTYRDCVAVLSKIWHEWFSARVRLAAVAVGLVADAMPRLSAGEREALMTDVERLGADGHTVLERYADPTGHWGPEGRSWMRRLDAEVLRARWLSGVDAPSQDALVDAWRAAEEVTAEFGHVYELATIRVRLAGILRSVGDAASARIVSDQAREAAAGLGARPLLDELRSLGGGPARAETGTETLTGREQEILRHVAEGRSNGEIGKLLFISAKTVSVHVSNILAKLGAAGRTEAAAIARRDGLLDAD